ncbi:MAG: hypothetical protein L6R19_00850 [Alphaproteobacteria bacterium]|nr:hypothetical protein [Alphaproteobacteria bacterium]
MLRTLMVALGLLFAAFAPGARDAGAITDNEERTPITDRAELTRLFVDRTFYGRYADNSKFIEYYAPDGRAGYFDGCPHSGRWWVAESGGEAVVCFVYPTMAPPGPHCFDVFRAATRNGGRLEFLLDGSDASWPAHAWTRAIRPGNPEQLSLTASGCQIGQSVREEDQG